ncbi:sulfatase [Pelagicoccus enzymogenes]|uniref:sulfatase family protein n=1 Tax=Pelagicoccus enzymogenes TaxID=2773457 RepID=UPI00280F989A|nr:sulfatase [Pelagicoccus enzymogenes]MDQ8198938.1 sulfatase [Pelagicoccus enzymogenes]
MVKKSQPNILFALADDASYPFASAYGCDWMKTPAFDAVARSGLLFHKAYTPNAKCAPSRAAILTGRNSWQLEAAANHWCNFPAKFKSVTDTLSENGYHVGYTGKGWAPGEALKEDASPRDVIGPAYQSKTLAPPTSCISPCDYAANFEDFLDDRDPGQPFFFWYGGNEPHRPYEYQSGSNIGKKRIEDIDTVPPFWPDDERVRHDMVDHAFALEYFDSHLAKMLAKLEQIGELENTIVVVTADNGMPFPRIKGQAYDFSNRLPLAISWPQGIANPAREVESYLSFIDFAPTFLDYAGIAPETTGMHSLTGRSLRPVFENAPSHQQRNFVLIGKERHDIGRPNDVGYPIRGIVRDDFLYVINFEPDRWPAGNPESGYPNCDTSPTKTVILEGLNTKERHRYWELSFGKRVGEELYHLPSDRNCLHNLASDSDHKSLKSQLRAKLLDTLSAEEDPRIVADGSVFDHYPYADPRYQNFYERFTAGDAKTPPWVSKSDIQKS